MLAEVRALLILQDRDRRLLALAKDLEKLPQDEARARSKLAGDEAAVIKAHDALLAAELKVKKIELDTETRRTTIKRLKIQQFETRKNDEYQAFSHEITRYEKEIDGLETHELEAMEAVDKHREVHTSAKATLAHTRTLVTEDLASIVERKQRMESEHAAVTAERATLASRVPGSALTLYERLMRTKVGLAVAPMAESRCGGCHIKLIASTVIKAQADQEITQCENCGRILCAGE
ncbi:MAG: C4-type zinc ribbon domain-containing protein [Verrucomicrobia bacterium]|nr:C4-type zinc ribbon domain-containing protein [Verrucomicrobiota bacterium]